MGRNSPAKLLQVGVRRVCWGEARILHVVMIWLVFIRDRAALDTRVQRSQRPVLATRHKREHVGPVTPVLLRLLLVFVLDINVSSSRKSLLPCVFHPSFGRSL